VRGDVHELRPPRERRGHEQSGQRYAVVLQSDLLPLSTLLVAPTSTRAREASFRPEIVVGDIATRVMVEQTAAVDPSRLGRLVGHVGRRELDAVERALEVVLGLR
jgi:mRNA interferase MazF